VAAGANEAKWDGTVDLTPKSVLNARARNLKIAAPVEAAPVAEAPAKASAPKKAAPKTQAKADAAPAKKAAPKAKAKPAADSEA
jgi:large subunit ribosomal protein L21